MFFINDDVKMNIQTIASYPVKTGYSAKRKKSWKKGRDFELVFCLFVKWN